MSSGEPMTDHTAGQREPSAPSRGSVANHDAVPAAIASVDSVVPQPTTRGDSDRTDKEAPRPSEGTGNTPVAESATPDGYAYSGWPYPKGKMASISDAEIDALEFVVEEGRIASQMDYGVLRSLLVRLRPEWLDRPEPIKDEESDRSKPIAYTPPTHATPGECSKPREGTSEPVAWWLRGTEYDTGCEYEYVSLLKENAEAAAAEGGTVVPLYRAPTLTDAEREAVTRGAELADHSGEHSTTAAALRGLLKRLK